MVSMGIIGLLAAIAVTNFFTYSNSARDTAAESDYRNVKVAFFDLVNSENAPNRIVMRRVLGPINLPQPLQTVSLSPGVQVNLTYVKRFRNNRPPRTTTNLDVFHREGTVRYRYRERNGVVTEQQIALR